MIPNDQPNSLPAQLNDWANTSRWLGICSVLPYLSWSILLYIEKRIQEHFYQAEFILGVFCAFWGILLGSITLLIGIIAIRQIQNSQNLERGAGLATFGMILGAVAVLSNLVFIVTPFVIWMAND